MCIVHRLKFAFIGFNHFHSQFSFLTTLFLFSILRVYIGKYRNGKEWYRLRKLSQQTLLNPNIVNSYVPDCENITDELINLVRAERDGLEEMPDFQLDLYKWSLENISHVTMDSRLGCLNPNLSPDSDAIQMIKAAHDTIDGVMRTEMGQMDFWQYFPTKHYRKLCRGQTKMAEITSKHIQVSVLHNARKYTQTNAESERTRLLTYSVHRLLGNESNKGTKGKKIRRKKVFFKLKHNEPNRQSVNLITV